MAARRAILIASLVDDPDSDPQFFGAGGKVDEPAAGIDFQDQEKFYELIARLNQERGITILLVSHDLSVVSKHAHHVLCLKDGTLQCEGTPHDILNGEMLRATFGGDRGVYAHEHHLK